ncbi:MAG TPA: alpha/beta fold hydrolase [Anaerolineales bacterium]
MVLQKLRISLLIGLFSVALSLSHSLPAHSQGSSPEVILLNNRGIPIDHITDGDEIRLRVTLPQSAEQPMQVSFTLVGSETPLGECNIERGQDRCDSLSFNTLGWYWDAASSPVTQRSVQASAGGSTLAVSEPLPVLPRPVVMVHGFSSSWVAWENYLGPDGYLAQIGLQGFAVGDGQFEGTMNTGRLEQPDGSTNTIAQNAAILAEYIASVRKHTGAQKVDLLAHSMGGLISRYYIDRLMGESEVAQLIMLGSPMAGTDCANLPSALGFYLPAALEIRPNYVQDVFNQQITHRHGIAFHALAGIPILEAIKSPCTAIPSDIAVSRQSVGAIPLHVSEMPILHMELNTSKQVFEEYVRPLLQTTAGNFAYEPDPPLAPPGMEQEQFTRTFTGHVEPGGSQELTIPIDPDVAVASFALFDPTRSLNVTVRGASGNVIELDPVKNGLTIVDNPEALFYLGYGFNNPKPGVWKVTLSTSEKTPAGGADFALSASFQGGARLEAQASQLLPKLDEAVQFSARLDKGGQSLDILQAQTNVRSPDGNQESLSMSQAGEMRQVAWTPTQPGLYSVEISVSGRTPDGMTVERAAYFTVEAQPAPRSPLISWGILCLVMFGILAINLWVFAFLIKKNRQRANPGLS